MTQLHISEEDKWAALYEWPIELRVLKPTSVTITRRDGTEARYDHWAWQDTVGFDEYRTARLLFIDMARERGFTFQEIANLIGISKQRVHMLSRYGNDPLYTELRAAIRKRDKNRCGICGRTDGEKHVHHIGSSRDRSSRNLILLCPDCHRAADVLRRQALKKGIAIKDFRYAKPLVAGKKVRTGPRLAKNAA